MIAQAGSLGDIDGKALGYTTFEVGAGWIGILGSAGGLLRITLPRRSGEEARQSLGRSAGYASFSPHLFNDLMERLRVYFSGREAGFPDKLDLSGATPFQCAVWEATRLIPYGQTRSYAWVAERIDKPLAARAVGQSLARNPLPIIIPCHRVLSSNGHPGGFSGGLEVKRYLLQLEATAIM